MRNKLRLILIHVTGAILFLLVPILISPDLNNPDLFRIIPFRIDFISYALLLVFFYLHFFILIPQFYFKEKKLSYIVAVVLSYAAVAYLPLPLIHLSYAFYGSNFPYYLGHSLFKFLSVFIFSLMIKINNKLKQAEKDKLNAELSFLKAQVNPHFLFNTLNSIYSLAITEKAKETSAGIIKLSGMMRYISSATEKDMVVLSKELNYITNYIELQKKRFGHTVKITYSINGDAEGKEIVPLILISFVENAFKHGINSEEDSVIEIHIHIKDTTLELNVFNNKVNVLHEEELASGLGIVNTKNRLQLVYPDKHTLKIENTVKFFSVHLKLILQ
jgi:sensor histidine kinase YesM